jgi:ZIP family zinc transporter
VGYLGFFAGFLLYIGASDLLPEAHRTKSSYGLIALTALGALLMFLVGQVA